MQRSLALLLLAAGCQETTFANDDDPPGYGNGPDLGPELVIEDHLQGSSARSDILWVLDDSGSMSEEQDKLAANLSRFRDRLVASGTDWHVGVVTTDSTSASWMGRLREVAGYAFLAPELPRVDALFEAAVRVGTGGADDEQGLLAVQRALAMPTPDLQRRNAGFLRADAGLHVIVVSDEDDGSHDSVDTTELAAFLQGLKADPGTPVTFSSIVGPKPDGCQGRDTSASYGARYVVMTMRVGGLHRSICEDDWSDMLDALGLLAAGYRQEFVLAEKPVVDTLVAVVETEAGRVRTVWIDDDADAADACEGVEPCFATRYDPQRNAVRFVGAAPPDGARVRLRYEPLDGTAG